MQGVALNENRNVAHANVLWTGISYYTNHIANVTEEIPPAPIVIQLDMPLYAPGTSP